MQGVHLRKYGVETKIDFELYEVDGVDLRTDAVDAGSDCNIMKDEGAEATCENDFVDEGRGYSITLTATEMEAARIVLYIIDSATKVWLDKVIVIETYGNASAQHAMDFDDAVRGGMTALPNAAADAAGGLPVSDAGELDLDTKLANTNEITAARMGALTDWIDDGRLDAILDIIAADTNTDIPALLNTIAGYLDTEIAAIVAAVITNAAGEDIAADIIALKAETALIVADTNELQTDDIPAKITTAQNDLDTITGSDGVTLATAQGNYAPNKVVPDVAGTAATLHGTTDGKIDALNNISTAQVNTEVDNALNTAVPGSPTADSINERIKAIDDLITSSKIAAQVKGIDDIDLSATMKASVNTEIDTALSDINLDHLCKTATGAADMTTEIADNTILSRILANGDTSGFVPSTDGFQPIRDRGDDAWAGAPEAVSGTFTVQTADTVFNLTATLGTLSSNDDAHNNMIICMFDNSGSVYETRRITDYDGTNQRVTIDANLSFPGEDGVDTFVIYRAAYAPVGAASITEGDKNDIAGKVWDEADADHRTIGTTGLKQHHSGKGRY